MLVLATTRTMCETGLKEYVSAQTSDAILKYLDDSTYTFSSESITYFQNIVP